MTTTILPRDTRIDSVKGVLIILVVFGHLLTPFTDRSALYKAIYAGIFVFHMPLFVMIAGMFSKPKLNASAYQSIFSRLVFPLVIFQCLYVGFVSVKSRDLAAPVWQPYWILWFLWCTLLWKVTLPLVLRNRYCVAISIAVMLAAGYVDKIGPTLDLSRFLYFFPFFLIGHLYGRDIVAFAMTHRRAFGTVFGLVFGLVIAGAGWWSLHGLSREMLYGCFGYTYAPVIEGAPAVGRLLILALSLIASIAGLALFAGSWNFMIRIGQRSLAVYLLHGFAAIAVRSLLHKLAIEPSLLLLPMLLAVAVGIALTTSLLDAPLNDFFRSISTAIAKKGGARPGPLH
jgi:fucose 4-O-acetylase-like acetyltransferase